MGISNGLKIETEKLGKIFLIASIIFCFSVVLGTIKTRKDLAAINNPPQVSSAPKPTVSVIDETADWQTYKNEEYGFTLVFPLSWKGYRTVTESRAGSDNTNNLISFELPTSDKKWNYGSGFSSIFSIIILSSEEYNKLYKTDNLDDFKKDKYFFQFVFSSNGPKDLPPINEKEILSTFKFTE
ncbi:MAG: hypothetical protein V1732_02980 [Patescibacteria group bacterium]